MDLQSALRSPRKLAGTDQNTFYLNGSLEEHSEDEIRVYPDEWNKRFFYIVKKQDLLGDVYKWTDSEMSFAGFVGQDRYRIALVFGSTIQSVEITIERIGETLAGHTTETDMSNRMTGRLPAPGAASGECRYTTGCGNRPCCTGKLGGKCGCNYCCLA